MGQTQLLLAREPIASLLNDPATPPELQRRLRGVAAIREYARNLGLEVGGQYTSYVAWPGDRVVTTVVAARPGEVQAVGFRFPLIGRLPYKGFFKLDAAEAEASSLRAQGLDVCLVPVRAYSTLGWIDDPLTQPMLVGDDLDLSETLFHELVHATAHAPSAADFNESVATFIGQEATYAFVAAHGLQNDPRPRDELAALQRQRIIESRRLASELLRFQAEVGDLYATGAPGDGAREALESAARERVARLPLTLRDPRKIAEALQLNDACLALRGTYAGDLARHEQVFRALDRDLPAFVTHLRETMHDASENEDELRARFFSLQSRATQ